MARRTIHIDIMNLGSIQAAMREVEDYRRWLDEKCAELVKRLADIGQATATAIYAGAHDYEGEREEQVTVEQRGEATYAIVASGRTVLFLEFGAGVKFGGGHPQAGEFGYGPGTYPGQTHAFDPKGWWFEDADGKHHTYGNAPSMAMYNTAKELRERIEEVAREVFSND